MRNVTKYILYVLRKELSAIREHVVCHANLVMDFVIPYYKAGYDIIVSLFSCLNKKRRFDPRLALRHKPKLGRFNTRRMKLKKKFAVKIIFGKLLIISSLLQHILKLLPPDRVHLLYLRKRCLFSGDVARNVLKYPGECCFLVR
jgi:hypothetical protein